MAAAARTEVTSISRGALLTAGKQILLEKLIEAGSLRWKHSDERVVRCLGDRHLNRDRTMLGPFSCVTAEAAPDGRNRIRHGNVNDGHGAAGTAGAELFAEDARLAEQWPRVVDATGVDRDLIPAVQRV
jgi:hypothetical protein